MTGTAVIASALLAHRPTAPAGLTTWNGSDPAQRFAVYRNNVTVALVDALAATFPVTQALCGAEFFHVMAREFVRATPPASPVLGEYGQDFPEYIAGYGPARAVPCLAGVARLEAARIRVWYAADAIPLPDEAFVRWQESIGEAILTLHPAHAVLSEPYAIVSVWAAHNGMGELADVDVGLPEDALVIRPDLDTEIWRLPPGGAAFVLHLAAGRCVADAAMATLETTHAFDPAEMLALILRARLVIAISPGVSR